MAAGRSQIRSFPTPLVSDVLFYEIRDLSQDRHSNLNYGDPHPDKDRWPHHRLVSFQPVPNRGDNVYAIFYAADRKHQDLYNFEHAKADLGGRKFDTVTRNYIIRRDQYNPASPALGTVMPDVPAGKFAASSFHLIARSQDRISQRGARAEETIGGAELDSLYVVETRVYIDREEIVQSTYDETVGGVLFTRQNIFIRGETYDDGVNPAVTIETAAASALYWGVTSTAQLRTISQASDDVWVVTTQDLLNQSLTTSGNVFGGIVVKVYETSAYYSWPTVLGSDGVPENTGPLGFEIMDWEDKEGGFRNYVRPRIKRSARRMKTRCEIRREWLTQSQLDAIEGSAGDLNAIDDLDPKGIVYPSPYIVVNMPPSLHVATAITCNTDGTDPVWGENVNSTRTYPATTYTDWPDFVIADIEVQEFRGGYIVTQVKIFKPLSAT